MVEVAPFEILPEPESELEKVCIEIRDVFSKWLDENRKHFETNDIDTYFVKYHKSIAVPPPSLLSLVPLYIKLYDVLKIKSINEFYSWLSEALPKETGEDMYVWKNHFKVAIIIAIIRCSSELGSSSENNAVLSNRWYSCFFRTTSGNSWANSNFGGRMGLFFAICRC